MTMKSWRYGIQEVTRWLATASERKMESIRRSGERWTLTVLGKQSDCGDCVVTVFQRHCVDCSSTVTADEHNGFQRDNQLENTKHPLSPKQRVSERNATSGEKAGHRKTAASTEWRKERDFPNVKQKELRLIYGPSCSLLHEGLFLNCLQESPEFILIPLVLNRH